MTEWQPIDTAPKDGTWFIARRDGEGVELLTQWGKTSHVPLYGWCYVVSDYGDPDYDLWSPTHWAHLPNPTVRDGELQK